MDSQNSKPLSERIKMQIFPLFCTREFKKISFDYEFRKSLSEIDDFLCRYKNKLNFKGKTIIDIGFGLGAMCFYMGENGAKKVVGIEIDEEYLNYAKNKLENEYKYLSNIVQFKLPNEVGTERFDIVFSKSCFEHYANPEKFIHTMKKYMKESGIMVIGFSPLWKSPYGGHIGYLTKLPWAHLIFSEEIIGDELKRLRGPEFNIDNYGQGIHGLNKMNYNRFKNIIMSSGLKIEFLEINRFTKKYHEVIGIIINLLRRIPFLEEYFTINVYCILVN